MKRSAVLPMLPLAVLVALLPAACASTRATWPVPALAAGPHQVVFQTSGDIGGMSPANYGFGAQPAVTVYGNGDAYVVPDGQVDYRSYPGRPIALRKGTVPRDVLEDLVRDAATSRLFVGTDYGQARITEAATSTVSFRPGRAVARTVSVYALGIGDRDASLTADQQRNRASLRAFERRLYDSVVATRPWTPERIGVVAAYGHDDLSDPPLTWTGPDLDALLRRSKAHGTACGIVSGAAARRAWTAARANATTHWRDGSTDRYLVIRAVLPGERMC